MNAFVRLALFGLLSCSYFLAAPSVAQAEHFQQTLNGVCGGASAVCNIDFPVVPAGKTLEITNISCYLRLKDPAVPVRQQLQVIQPNGLVALTLSLQPLFIGRDEGIPVRSSYVANHPILAVAIAGQHFRVNTTTFPGGLFFEFSCHISGTLTP